jgi:hypothetical protein
MNSSSCTPLPAASGKLPAAVDVVLLGIVLKCLLCLVTQRHAECRMLC